MPVSHVLILIHFCTWLSYGLNVVRVFLQPAGVIAEAKELVANGGNTQQLREENISLYKEKEKVLHDLKACQKALRDSEAKAKEQAEKDAQTIQELQDSLNLRLDEIAALDEQILGKFLPFSRLFSSLLFS